MDLREYLFKHEMKNKDFATKVGVSYHHISQLKCRRTSPSLFLAAKIHIITGGQVTFTSLLNKRDADKMVKFLGEVKGDRYKL